MTTSRDPFNLDRFLVAQESVYVTVLSELRDGRKRSHWMWFVFPQIAGLGPSAMAQHYAIGGLAEAAAYLAHPILGPRLVDCTCLVTAVESAPLIEILGRPDDLKFHSSMTLFSLVDSGESVFHGALDRFFDGRLDDKTVALAESSGPS